ncbi:hypothetical protein ABW20_dc0108584 [Dactylellina cionopaga]|nr:hypothetical protein ABW20_dc0108584 [Dactylellina cionopaga]
MSNFAWGDPDISKSPPEASPVSSPVRDSKAELSAAFRESEKNNPIVQSYMESVARGRARAAIQNLVPVNQRCSAVSNEPTDIVERAYRRLHGSSGQTFKCQQPEQDDDLNQMNDDTKNIKSMLSSTHEEDSKFNKKVGNPTLTPVSPVSPNVDYNQSGNTKLWRYEKVLINVGGEGFKVDTSALRCSGYFRNYPFRHKVVEYQGPGCTPKSFQKFVQFCYEGDYSFNEFDPEVIELHARVYILSIQLFCYDLKYQSLTKAQEWCNEAGSMGIDNLLYVLPIAISTIWSFTERCDAFTKLDDYVATNPRGHTSSERDPFRVLLGQLVAENYHQLIAKVTPSLLQCFEDFPEFFDEVHQWVRIRDNTSCH